MNLLQLTEILSVVVLLGSFVILFRVPNARSRRPIEVIILMCSAHVLIVHQIKSDDAYVGLMSLFWIINCALLLFLNSRERVRDDRRI